MANGQKIFAAFNAELDNKEKSLLQQRRDIRNFVQTLHTSKETEAAQAAVSEAESELSIILDSLLDTRDIRRDFRSEAEKLCERCRDLNTYTRDMHSALSEDFAKRKSAEDKETIDVIKNAGFFFAIPLGFAGAIKAGVGNGTVTPNGAIVLGIIVSSAVIAHKRLKNAFNVAGKSACDASHMIKNSFFVFYTVESIKKNKAVKFLASKMAINSTRAAQVVMAKTITPHP